MLLRVGYPLIAQGCGVTVWGGETDMDFILRLRSGLFILFVFRRPICFISFVSFLPF